MIWIALVLSISYVNIKQTTDPSFSWSNELGSFYSLMHLISILLFVLYSSYFVLVAYISFFQGSLRDMKHSYKISLLLTFSVIILFLVLTLLQAYSSDLSVSPSLHVAFLSLVNFYMYLIAYLYSPSVESL